MNCQRVQKRRQFVGEVVHRLDGEPRAVFFPIGGNPPENIAKGLPQFDVGLGRYFPDVVDDNTTTKIKREGHRSGRPFNSRFQTIKMIVTMTSWKAESEEAEFLLAKEMADFATAGLRKFERGEVTDGIEFDAISTQLSSLFDGFAQRKSESFQSNRNGTMEQVRFLLSQ